MVNGNGGGGAGVPVVPAAPPKSDGPAPPPMASSKTDTITFYDGNSVQVYPFATEGTGSESWWANIKRGWEEDSLYSLKAMLSHK